MPYSLNSYAMENPVKAHRYKTYQKRKGMSFFAFLFSIVIYISIFYIFSLSPSALFNNTKFWFVISNTLILIIAVDYGAFSSSKDQKPDLYEEYNSYALHSRQTRSINSNSTSTSTVASPFASQYPEVEKSININNIPHREEMMSLKYDETKEYDNNICIDDVAAQNKEIGETPAERILEVVKFEATKTENEADDGNDHRQVSNETTKKNEERRIIRRSKSDRVKRATFHDEEVKSSLKRSETGKHEPTSTLKDDENEFSTMSDEELNRRVEEFIQNFNRQIRLQGARSRQILVCE